MKQLRRCLKIAKQKNLFTSSGIERREIQLHYSYYTRKTIVASYRIPFHISYQLTQNANPDMAQRWTTQFVEWSFLEFNNLIARFFIVLVYPHSHIKSLLPLYRKSIWLLFEQAWTRVIDNCHGNCQSNNTTLIGSKIFWVSKIESNKNCFFTPDRVVTGFTS